MLVDLKINFVTNHSFALGQKSIFCPKWTYSNIDRRQKRKLQSY